MLAYREHAAQERGVDGSTAAQRHQARDRAPRLRQGVPPLRASSCGVAPVDPRHDPGRRRLGAPTTIDDQTVALIGSACNYGYGTVDPIARPRTLALERGVGLHVDGCLGGFILPFGQELGYDIPPFDFRVPGVTSISADTHKYGYAFKGTSALLFRDQGPAQRAVLLPDRLERREVHLARHGGLALGRPARPRPGRRWCSSGARATASTPGRSSRRPTGMQEAVRAHPELRLLGRPTFLLQLHLRRVRHLPRRTTSCGERGWRFNGQQYPNALHMAVTGPQTQPGVVEQFAADLADAVAYAAPRRQRARRRSRGAIYGGVAGGSRPRPTSSSRTVMADMLDTQQSLPP